MRNKKLFGLLGTLTLAAAGVAAFSGARENKTLEVKAASDWTLNIKFNGSLPDWANAGSSLGLHFGGAWTNNDSSDWGWSKDVYVSNNGTTTAKFGEYERIRVVQGVFYQNSDKKETYVLGVSPKLDLNYDGAHLTFTLPSSLTWDGSMISNASCKVEKNAVTLNANGGSCTSLTEYYTGVETKLPSASKSNCNFLGWSKNQDLSGDLYTSIPKGTTGNQTFYAKYEQIPVDSTITFDANGGTFSGTNPVIVTGGQSLAKPTDPTRDNHKFLGWYIGDNKVTFPYTPTGGAITLTAKWSLNGGVYLAGTGFWDQDGSHKMIKNGDKTEFYLKDISLKKDDELRVYYSETEWADINDIQFNHPLAKCEKSVNNLKVNNTGTYDVYFDTTEKKFYMKRTDLGELPDWGYGIAVNPSSPTLKSEVLVPTKEEGTQYNFKNVSLTSGDKIFGYYQGDAAYAPYKLYVEQSSPEQWSHEASGNGLVVPATGTYSLYLMQGTQGKDVISIVKETGNDANNFMKGFNDAISGVCKAYGTTDKNDLKAAWNAQATAFASLSEYAKGDVTSASSSSHTDDARAFAEKYDYVFSVYGVELELSNFASRDVSSSARRVNPIVSLNNVDNSVWIISIISLVGLTSIGGYFFYRKRKEN